MSGHLDVQAADRNGLLPPSRAGKDGRSLSAASIATTVRPGTASSAATSGAPPGSSIGSDLRSVISRADSSRVDLGTYGSFVDEDALTTSEQRQAQIRDRIDKETKIKVGSENLLEALNSKNAKQSAKQTKEQKLRVEAELNQSNKKLAELRLGLEAEIQKAKEPALKSDGSRLSFMFQNALRRSPSRRYAQEEDNVEPETESPTFVLAEILQALEASGMPSDYYVERANNLVDLFKRYPTLKYDLAWSVFGVRIQTMLLNDSREVVAAGYRLVRYAIADRRSLQVIRGLNTDYLVMLSLVKETKASVEREQALKFIRAFLDVKDGVQEISPAIVRIIVAIAEQNDDRLKSMALLTIAELLIRDPPLVVSAGGVGVLSEALGEGNYHAAESLTSAFLYLLDLPSRRKFLRSGHELEIPFASFTESPVGHTHEEKLKANARVISSLLRSWPGLLTLSMNDFQPIRSLLMSLYIPLVPVRNVLLELLIDILRVKPPSWSSSFLAGRRLTTYGRVTNLKMGNPTPPRSKRTETDEDRIDLVEHFTAVVLAVLLRSGLLEALLYAEENPLSETLKRKTTLVLGEVLRLASDLLPESWSSYLQVLPGLIQAAARFEDPDRLKALAIIYQVDSVNRTLYRSEQSNNNTKAGDGANSEANVRQSETPKSTLSVQMDEGQFRTVMLESGVLNTVNFSKWRWDIIQNSIDGPMLNPKRLDEAIKVTKYVHRLLNFFRPFRYRFSDVKNTKPNQRYVKAGASLMRTLLKTKEGAAYLGDSKTVRQLAECLSHFDRMSGLTSAQPLFSPDRMTETLTGGYFTLLGAMSQDAEGIRIFERWKMINMFYHIIELEDRDDLIVSLLTNLDYSLDSHPRIILGKAMVACSKEVRIMATGLLRKYASRPIQTPDSIDASADAGTAEWAIRLLVTQLYDPEIEVCEVAIKILEAACNQKRSLEYVVNCRPALDHLGEIGAPLLLRFLSTSVGYHYLDGLDYITKEMEEWFMGRNDSYVAQVEALLVRALSDVPGRVQSMYGIDDTVDTQAFGFAPPHFYRELTRTAEGCKLLERKGHFDEFAATIEDYGMEDEDQEMIVKVKGCMWAVGNIGSMELGAPFLEKSDVVKWIVDIAENSQVMTIRGTAFFVLGLISRSLHGQEILLEHGWDGTVNVTGKSLGFCIPLDFKKLFSVIRLIQTY